MYLMHIINFPQIEDEYVIHLYVNGNATLGNRSIIRLVILVNDYLKLANNHHKGKMK